MPRNDTEVARLSGTRVLVAEDEALIALELEAILGDLGCLVLGPTNSVTGTLGLLDTDPPPDAALLDARLLDGRVTPAAEACLARGVPFALATGYDEDTIMEPVLLVATHLTKPFSVEELRRVLVALVTPRPASQAGEA